MKLGLDFDGVISDDPDKFSWLSGMLVGGGQEVHIITGNRGTPEFLKNLDGLGIWYTHFFSISDYHHDIGTPMTGYEENNTWIDEEVWNKSKAIYCAKYGIDLHIDDSPIYGEYFQGTTYILYRGKNAA